ncbi:hypothetical protein D3C86_2249420 [compost metagenome]
MTRQHAAQHDEVRAATEGFRYVARYRAATVTDDLAAQAMCRIGALDHRRQLRVANTGFHPGGTD